MKIVRLVFLILVLIFVAGCKLNSQMPANGETSNGIGDKFPDLNEAKQPEIVEINDKAIFQLEASSVKKTINGDVVKMFAYNGQIPGPVIKVKQGTSIFVNFTNNLDVETTIHWHGIRLKNKYDGVPNITQQPIKPKESFLYELTFPDEGIYWYHPHIREDFQQELGLYGNIIVEPKTQDYYNKVNREIALFLDDIKMAENNLDIFGNDFAGFALMGRFGNEMLVNGQTDYKIDVNKNEITRFYLTDSANTRTFNFLIENHKLKLIGSDSGKYENEKFIDSVILSPGERYIVEVLFDKIGSYKILHKTPSRVFVLGVVNVKDGALQQQNLEFEKIKENNEIKKDIEQFKKYFDTNPDFEIDLTVDMDMMQMDHGMPMNTNQKIEWEDDMSMMNAMSTSKNTKWIIRDKKTGKENMDISYEVKVGDVKKIRIVNDPNSMHPMQHPIHLHGQRFLVLEEDGKKNENLAWKDTVLVPKGSTVDILVYFTNPGDWMLHCHIAEHLESGMMTMFKVLE